jgi:hypothetical protein
MLITKKLFCHSRCASEKTWVGYATVKPRRQVSTAYLMDKGLRVADRMSTGEALASDNLRMIFLQQG